VVSAIGAHANYMLQFDLDGSEEGERWSLPIHLMDAFLYVQSGRVSTFEQRGVASDILSRLSVAVQQGILERHIQRLPHGEIRNLMRWIVVSNWLI